MGMKSEVEQALEAHAAWRRKFRDYLSGRASFDADSAGANDQCQFGKWLNREGHRLMPSDLHDQIRAAHDEFHRIAGGIVKKIKDKQFDAARLDLAPDGPFNHASEQLSALLHKATLREPGPAAGGVEGKKEVAGGESAG
jgi:hypothetical protein